MTSSTPPASIGPTRIQPTRSSAFGPPEMSVAARVREFISEFFYVTDPAALEDDRSLIDSGIVDSTGMMDVIVFLETEYGFHVEDEEMVPENLESIGQITRFVERKTAAGPAVTPATPAEQTVP